MFRWTSNPVLDTNVYFSAFRNPEGVSARIFRAGADRHCQIILSPEIIYEYASACREKLQMREEKIQEDIKFIVRAATDIVQPSTLFDAVPDDPDDNHILAWALAGKADLIVSRDKDLLRLKEYEGIAIIRPMDFESMLSLLRVSLPDPKLSLLPFLCLITLA